jgi:hypothetical protein
MSNSVTTIREKNQASYYNMQMVQQTKRDIPIQKHPVSKYTNVFTKHRELAMPSASNNFKKTQVKNRNKMLK